MKINISLDYFPINLKLFLIVLYTSSKTVNNIF